jgi:hypothetical protein
MTLGTMLLLIVVLLMDASRPERPLETGLETCYADVLSLRAAVPYHSAGACIKS